MVGTSIPKTVKFDSLSTYIFNPLAPEFSFKFLSFAGGGDSFQEVSTKILLTDFELRESLHSGSYNFREGVHKIFLPTYFLLSRPISGKKISTGDLDNILLRYFGFLEHRLREGRTFLVRVNGGGVTFTRVP